MRDLAAACANLEVNQLCYGGGNVEVFADGLASAPFTTIGDQLPVSNITRIQTGVGADDCTWGGVLFKLQGTAPLSQPITFVALGNVLIENAVAPEELFLPSTPLSAVIDVENVNFRRDPGLNAEVIGQFDTGAVLNVDALSADGQWLRVDSDGRVGWVSRELVHSTADLNSLPTLTEHAKGWMQAFTVRTAPSTCNALLPSLLIVQTPGGVVTPLSVNGIDLTVGSTIVLNTIDPNASGLGGPDTVDPNANGLGGPDTVDPNANGLGGPDTVDPNTSSLGGPDTFPADALTQMIVLHGAVNLDGWKTSDSHYSFSYEGAFLAQGMGVNDDDSTDGTTLDDLVVPQGTGLLINTSDQESTRYTGKDSGVFLSFIDPADENIGEIDASDAENIDDNIEVVLSDGIISVDDLLPVQALGVVLQEDPHIPKIDLPDYFGDWVKAEGEEPSGTYCDDFEVISPKTGTIVLPPDSDLTFKYPSQATFNWSTYYQMPESVRLGMSTIFHLARPNGNDLKAPISQEYYFPADDAHLQNTSLLDPKSITYNYYQLQGMGLIIPGATSGQLVWWVENTLYYIGFADASSLPTGFTKTCITSINIVNWTNTLQAEQPDILIVPVPGGETPFFTPQPLPIVQPTAVPPSPDGDGDGVPDATDRCPRESGPVENGGCPLPTQPPDRDGDTVPDNRDRCPDQRGSVDNAGCPVRSGG